MVDIEAEKKAILEMMADYVKAARANSSLQC
jgi:hypothetical protein